MLSAHGTYSAAPYTLLLQNLTPLYGTTSKTMNIQWCINDTLITRCFDSTFVFCIRLFNDASISTMIMRVLSLVWFPNLTRAYDNNGRCPRQKFVFGILQLYIYFRV